MRILTALLIALSFTLASRAQDRVLVVDPAKPTQFKASSIAVANGVITTAQSVSSAAINGTNAGPAAAGTVIKAGPDGLVSATLLPPSRTILWETNVWKTNGVSVATNLMSRTTTLGTGAVTTVYAAISAEAGTEAWKVWLTTNGVVVGRIGFRPSSTYFYGRYDGYSYTYLAGPSIGALYVGRVPSNTTFALWVHLPNGEQLVNRTAWNGGYVSNTCYFGSVETQ